MTTGSYRTSSPLRVGPIKLPKCHFASARRSAPALLLGSALAFIECGGGGSPTSPAPVVTVDPNTPGRRRPPVTITPDPEPVVPTTPPVIPPPGTSSTFVNVLGDTGWCGSPALGPLSRLFERFDGDILLAGDLAYPSGTMEEFRNCFEPSFGRFKSRMRASPGNHDYVASVSANSYFDYFGERSGPNRLGYYSFSAAEWTMHDAELERADRQDLGAVRVRPHDDAADADALHDGGAPSSVRQLRHQRSDADRCATSGS